MLFLSQVKYDLCRCSLYFRGVTASEARTQISMCSIILKTLSCHVLNFPRAKFFKSNKFVLGCSLEFKKSNPILTRGVSELTQAQANTSGRRIDRTVEPVMQSMPFHYYAR